MALVSGVRSNLNPNAPLFIPAAVRQVEDFSPEWWNLVTTATWFREYWLSQQQGEDVFGEEYDSGNDVVELLPDTIDLGVDEDILNMEEQFEEFLHSSEAHDYYGSKATKGVTENGVGKNAGAVVKSLSMLKERGAMREPMKNWEKPAKIVSPKCSPRFIQQPR